MCLCDFRMLLLGMWSCGYVFSNVFLVGVWRITKGTCQNGSSHSFSLTVRVALRRYISERFYVLLFTVRMVTCNIESRHCLQNVIGLSSEIIRRSEKKTFIASKEGNLLTSRLS